MKPEDAVIMDWDTVKAKKVGGKEHNAKRVGTHSTVVYL
jgi:hypothetical protein